MNKKKSGPNLWFYFSMAVFGEFCLSILAGVAAIWVLDFFFDISLDLPFSMWVLVASSTVAGVIALVLNRRILRPLRTLGRALNRVAGGDFKTRLTTRSRMGDIQQIYEDFNLMAAQLDKTEMLQSDFVSNVSHEFKTPINAIEGYAMLLQGTPQATQEQSEYIHKILSNTQRLSSLIGDILLLSKVENQTVVGEITCFRLDEQIRQAILSAETQWVEKEIDFDVDLEEITYSGNERLMFHVWNNLIGNAIKFNRRGGMVRLRLVRMAGDIGFTVEDEGPGISQEAMGHIFDKFYQADSSHQQEGSGLGLALVKRILNACGGTVRVENLPKRGCRFTVVLPDERPIV